MKRSIFFSSLAVAILGLASPAFAQPLPTDPLELTAGKLTGWYTVTVESGNQKKTVNATISSTTPDRATLVLDGKTVSLVRKTSSSVAKLVGAPGVINVLDPNAQGPKIDLTIKDRVTLEGTFTETLNGANKTTKLTLRRTPRPARTPEELAEFDPGPSEEIKQLFTQCPPSYKKLFPYTWSKFGPVFYRGRLDRSARVMIMGSDPGPTECLPWVRRCLVGDSGQRIQGFLTKLGLTKSYVMMNAFAFALYPSASNKGKGDIAHNDPEIVKWRNACYSRVVGPDLQAIVVIGFQAKRALDLWTDRPQVPVFYLPHPSRFDGEPDSNLIPSYRDTVNKMRKIVTPDDAELVKKTPNYGEEFTELDFSPIPRRDLPEGAWVDNKWEKTPAFIGEDSWTRTSLVPLHNVARRPSPDDGVSLVFTTPDGKERSVYVTPHPTGDPMRNPRFHYADAE